MGDADTRGHPGTAADVLDDDVLPGISPIAWACSRAEISRRRPA
jgi:hypothetical protein